MEELTNAQLARLPPGAVFCNVVVALKDGKPGRLCWAGGRINDTLDNQRFRMEGWAEIAQMLEPGDVAFSLDLEKGYSQIPLKIQMRDFCLFKLGDRRFRFRVMPFGLASAPRDFSYIVERIVAIFRKRGFRCAFYIDDLIFLARSHEEARRMRRVVLRLSLIHISEPTRPY